MIRFEHVNKTYKGAAYEVSALQDVNLHIQKGEFVGIMGKSGSGKSTLLNIIGLMDTLDEGTYCLAGQDVSNLNAKEITALRNAHICFVFQHFALVNELTVFENIEIPLIPRKVVRRKRTEQVIEMARLLEIEDLLKKRPDEISGGQKQRTAIARALVSGCDIILADEPTGALDSGTAGQIMELFVQLNRKGKTVVVVTHDSEVAKSCKRVIRIEDGRIADENY